MRLKNLILLIITLTGTVISVKQLTDDFPFQRNLWLYWHQNLQSASFTIRLCYEKYKQITKKANFELILLNRTNLRDYISDYEQNFQNVIKKSKQTQVANIADLIRLLVLEQHGGIWVDFSTVFFEGLGWLEDLMHGKYQSFLTNKFSDKPEALLFYYGNFQNRVQYRLANQSWMYNQYPGYEIWWIAVRKQCQFIKNLRITFSRFTQYSYDELENLFIQEDIFIHNQDDGGSYLAQNMAVTYILQTKQKELDKSLALFSKRKTVFEEYKIWGLHGQLGPLAFCRKERATQLDCFDKTIEEIQNDVMPLMFFVKLVKAVRVLFDQKLKYLIQIFVKKFQSFEQFMASKPTLQICQNLKLIIKGSVMSNLLKQNKVQNDQLKIPVFTIQQRQIFNKYCHQLNHYKQFPLDTSQTSYFDYYVSSRGQRAKIQQIQRYNKPKMTIIQWIKYQWKINSFLLKVIIILSFLIPLLFLAIFLGYKLLKKFLECIFKSQIYKSKENYNNSKKFLIYFLIWITLITSIGYFLVVDIFGGKDQPFSIFLVVTFVLLLQMHINMQINYLTQTSINEEQKIRGYNIQISEEQLQKSPFNEEYNKKDGYLYMVHQVSSLVVSYFITYLALGLVRKHKFLQMYYSFILGIVGPCLFRLVEILDEKHRYFNNKQSQILNFLTTVSKQEVHKILLIAFLLLVNIIPNTKYLVTGTVFGNQKYFLAQLVIILPLLYLLSIGIYLIYQCIVRSLKSDLIRMILLILSVYLAYEGRVHLIVVLTEFRIVWMLLMTFIGACLYIQFGEELEIFKKQQKYQQKSLLFGEILIYFGFLIYEFLNGPFSSRLSELKRPQISVSEIIILFLNIALISIYQQLPKRSYQVSMSQQENSTQLTDTKK